MKAITRYQANDGSEFKTESACAAYEVLCEQVEKIMAVFPALPKDDGCDFVNGGGFFQHNAETFQSVRTALLKIAQKECPHRWIDESLAGGDVHSSWAGRIISESDATPLYRAWSRISCVDKQFREWGQPYYAEHPEAAKQVCLNAAGAA